MADYYERALYNHILGQQDPKTGMVAYFLPLKAGTHKVYSTPENSFWCCVGSGFESHAKYAENIYSRTRDGLFVNLFIPSVVDWKEKGMRVRLDTEFPESETVRLSISADAPVRAALNLRYPSWSGKAEVRINGKKVKIASKPGTYIVLEREWKDGDFIKFDYKIKKNIKIKKEKRNIK